MEADDRATLATLDAYRAVFQERVTEHRGRIIDTAGDSVLAVFPSVIGAVEAAIVIQDELRCRNEKLPDQQRMHFRIGINLGDVIEKSDGTVYGSGVNIAARLEALAEPGGVAVSEEIRRQVGSKLEVIFESAGEFDVKNIERPVQVYRTRREPLRRVGANSNPSTDLPNGPAIAVLPFTNMSHDPEQDMLSDGISEEIITALTQFRDLFVIARNTTFQYSGPSTDPKRVHQDLGADFILEGSVRRAGNMIRVTAQLIDGASLVHLWAETYDRNLTPENLFKVQDDITANVVASIAGPQGVISRAAFEATRGKATDSLTAYEYVLRARAYSIAYSVENHRGIRDGLEHAIQLDPEYADAWAWLAQMYIDEHRYNFNPRPASLDRALNAAQRSVELEPNNQLAHFELALAYFFRHDIDQFITETDKTIHLNPNNTAIALLGIYMGYAGKWQEGLAIVRRAAALNPNHPGWFHYLFGKEHYRKGEYEQALLEFRKINTPSFFMNHVVLAYTFGQLGRTGAADAELAEIQRLYPGFTVGTLIEEYGKFNFSPEYIEHSADGLRKAGLAEGTSAPACD
jgi:adenylate cyclase